MKKIISIFILGITIVFLFTSCGQNNSNSIVGEWVVTSESMYDEDNLDNYPHTNIVFNEDGTFSNYYPGKNFSNFGNYSVSTDTITFSMGASSSDWGTYTYSYEISKNQLTLTRIGKNCDPITYERSN